MLRFIQRFIFRRHWKWSTFVPDDSGLDATLQIPIKKTKSFYVTCEVKVLRWAIKTTCKIED